MSIHIYSQRNKAILFDPTKIEINNVDRISDSRLDNRKKTNLEIIWPTNLVSDCASISLSYYALTCYLFPLSVDLFLYRVSGSIF